MAFEKFKPIGFRSRINPAISISRSGIGISAGFARKYSAVMAGAEAIELFYDKERNAIGFKFVPAATEGALKMKPLGGGGYHVSALSFLVSYDIDRDLYESRYIPKEEQTPAGSLFVLELKRKE